MGFERFSTACANAYVRPLIERYLDRFDASLRERGFRCPLLLMLSSGGLTTVETAKRFPVRLMESGPAGGAIFAGAIARANRLDKAMSFDMGGTTAKICLVDGGSVQTSRRFEVARVYRFRKDSGIPLRIPVIDMVEIGAGGGSIAWIDELGRLSVGPESAGAQPGPASRAVLAHRVYHRDSLAPGQQVSGPAVITENETTTVVASQFDARILDGGEIELTSRPRRQPG